MPEGAAVAAPSGGLGAPARGTERGPGRRTHYGLRSTHPPTRVREWVSYEADWGSGGSCWIRRRSRATCCRKRAKGGMWVAALGAAAHSRDLLCCVNRVEVIPS